MNTVKIRLSYNEFLSLLNILNEVCREIGVNDFEKAIGTSKQTVIDFIDKISREPEKEIIDLNLSKTELTFLIHALDDVLKQTDEWNLQARIGVTVLEVIKVRQRFTQSYLTMGLQLK